MQQKYQIIVSAVGKGIRQTTSALNQGFTRGKKALVAFNAAAGRTKQLTSGLSGSLKGLIGIGALGYLVKHSIELSDNLAKTAAAINMSTDALDKYRYIADRSGIATSQVDQAFKKFSSRFSDLARGSGPLINRLKGVNDETLKMLKNAGSSTEALKIVFSQMKKYDGQVDATRIATAAFGRLQAATMTNLVKHMKELEARYEKLGLHIDKDLLGNAESAKDAIDDVGLVIRRSFTKAVLQLAPEIEQIASGMARWISANQKFLKQELAAKIKKIVPVIVEWIKWAGKLIWKWKAFIATFIGIKVILGPLKVVVGLFQGLNAAFTVLIGMGMIEWAGSFRLALNTLAVAATAAGVALRAMVAGMAAWGVIKIYQAIKAYREMRDAQQDVARASQMATKAQDRALKSLDRFRDAKLPEDITGRNEAELKRFQAELFRAGLYYQTLRDKLETKAKETTWLGVATEEAQAAQQQLPEVNRRLSEIRADMERLRKAGIDAAEGMKKPAHAVMATAEQLEEFEKQARKTYEYARSQAEKYADKVIEYEEKIKNARMSTADKIRELQRKGLSEQEQWNDKRLQADEKMMAARQALRENDYERAKKLADDAQRLYADLATEVHEKRDGEDVVIKSIEDTKKVAVAGVREAGRFIEKLYEAQKETAEKSKAQWEATADKINEKLEWVARARETDIEIKLLNLASVQSAINSLIRDETKHITVVETRKIKTEEQKAGGGIVGLSRGGRLPGFGGGDRIRALLEAGEFVIRKEAVRKYGAVLFEALNSLRLPQPSLPIMKFAKGGLVPAGGEVITVNFRAGGVEMPLRVVGSPGSTRDQIRRFDAELRKMGLVRG